MRAKSEDGTIILTFDSLDEFSRVTGLSGPAEWDISSTTTAGTTLKTGGTTTITLTPLPTATKVVSSDVLTLEKFLNRYRVEPRGNNTGIKWMVIYDKKKGDYVKDTDSVSGKAYLKFRDTDEMFEFFKENNKL